ncbi:hypothetical protein GF1_11600 [Desulfolithobacter dissulfuricans]|uniref:Uncharacterized protein n=1 Tax=Desulfolithobacter dissulfuricans TaxID=2795293 RepID=A0A915U0N4_9BACT|nr:hypothetical protein [Desulfolithobacter dissulfuricans]BCO08784.1 hypothetical protein GF1_11600 [Desulfolithobacter dissulfuricans]
MPVYHVKIGARRTTVSLPKILSTLLAIKLNRKPKTKEAAQAVRSWLQQAIDKENDPGMVYVSSVLQEEAILFIADKSLSDRYLEFLWEDDEDLQAEKDD